MNPLTAQNAVLVGYGMYGLGFRAWSAGIEDVLAVRLRKIAGVFIPPTRGFSEWRSIVEDARKLPASTKIAIYGHSLGSNNASYAADELRKIGRAVDAVIGYDATWSYPAAAIGSNVKNLISIKNHDAWSWLGKKYLQPGPDYRGAKPIYIDTADNHVVVDDDLKLHAPTINLIASLAAAK